MHSAYLNNQFVKRPSFRSVIIVHKLGLKAPAAVRSCYPTCTVLRVNVYSSWRRRLSRIYYVFIFQSSLWMYIWVPDQTWHEGIVWLCIQIYLTEAAAATVSARMCSPSSRRHAPVAPPTGLPAIADVGKSLCWQWQPGQLTHHKQNWWINAIVSH